MTSESTRPPEDPAERTLLPVSEAERTLVPGRDPAPGPSPEAPRPSGAGERRVLGIVAIYSATAGDPGVPRSELGRVYPLREGEVLFVGKPPPPDDLSLADGTPLRITHAHCLTFGEEFEYVSRAHVAIEMLEGGRFRLHDYSTNGVFLEQANRHLRRPANLRPQTHEIEGREVLVLGVDLATNRERKARDRAVRSRIQVVPLIGGGLASLEVTRA